MLLRVEKAVLKEALSKLTKFEVAQFVATENGVTIYSAYSNVFIEIPLDSKVEDDGIKYVDIGDVVKFIDIAEGELVEIEGQKKISVRCGENKMTIPEAPSFYMPDLDNEERIKIPLTASDVKKLRLSVNTESRYGAEYAITVLSGDGNIEFSSTTNLYWATRIIKPFNNTVSATIDADYAQYVCTGDIVEVGRQTCRVSGNGRTLTFALSNYKPINLRPIENAVDRISFRVGDRQEFAKALRILSTYTETVRMTGENDSLIVETVDSEKLVTLTFSKDNTDKFSVLVAPRKVGEFMFACENPIIKIKVLNGRDIFAIEEETDYGLTTFLIALRAEREMKK